MIFHDAIFRNRRNEPWWFKVIRRIFALSFVIMIFLYGISQFKNIKNFLYTPNIVIVELKNGVNFPGFVICPESVNPKFPTGNESQIESQIEPQFSITCGYSKVTGPEVLSENTNNIDDKCTSLISKAENGCLRYLPDDKYITEDDGNVTYSDNEDNTPIPINSFGFNQTFMFFNIKPNIQTDTSSFYTLYFENYIHQEDGEIIRYSDDDDNKYYIEYNNIIIDPVQRNIIEYSIDIHRVFSTGLIGLLNIVPDLYSMEIKVDIKNMPRKQQTTETQFVLLPKIPHYLRQEIERFEYHPLSFFSSLGGFHSAIMAFYVFVFGMARIEPWGYLQKSIFRCWIFRRDFKRELAYDYNTEPGIPLSDNIEDIPREVSLEERVQSIEYLLKDYYIGSYYADSLRDTKLRYEYQEILHERLENSLSLPLTIHDSNLGNPLAIPEDRQDSPLSLEIEID
ncbi:hypothetical protein RclHR1_03530017 [Rhizophagus clarus]|uniref:Uncharacterized protein n=1 Tax=Rhizophagus clarus TaxID=94130 RepID=A0A2Z6RBZ9_9GLOM|nr:hypothetical protein RclHR1_03530017 [Rhizophagus clarus]GES96891.1 hypothetical protein GLOIN_2v1569202 [Rhizophagus clarus]